MANGVKIRSKLPLERCKSCHHEHLGGDCGMTFAQRIKTVNPATEWMPARMEARTTTITDDQGVVRQEKEYYDDELLKETFGDGLTGKERKEELLESTQGVGFATPEDIEKHPDLVAAHFLEDPKDIVTEGG